MRRRGPVAIGAEGAIRCARRTPQRTAKRTAKRTAERTACTTQRTAQRAKAERPAKLAVVGCAAGPPRHPR